MRRLGLYDVHIRVRETESSMNIEVLDVDNQLRGVGPLGRSFGSLE